VKRNSQGILLLALLCLLGLATSAWAECSWVLWANWPATGEWRPVRAFDDPYGKSSCEFIRSVELHDKNVPEGALVVCLPDTVDPRGPKG
jgi:hypothetical protein